MSTDEDSPQQPGPDDEGAGRAPSDASEPRPGEVADEPLPPADGLDLARAIARATAGSGVEPARRTMASGGPRPEKRRRAGRRVSGAYPDDRDPQLLDATVSRLVGDHGWGLSLRVQGVFARWPDIVGPEISSHARPESFTDGKLVVRTDSTAWARELSYQVQALLTRLNEELGRGTVTLIEVVGPQAPSWKKGPRSVKGRGPRDTYG